MIFWVCIYVRVCVCDFVFNVHVCFNFRFARFGWTSTVGFDGTGAAKSEVAAMLGNERRKTLVTSGDKYAHCVYLGRRR